MSTSLKLFAKLLNEISNPTTEMYNRELSIDSSNGDLVYKTSGGNVIRFSSSIDQNNLYSPVEKTISITNTNNARIGEGTDVTLSAPVDVSNGLVKGIFSQLTVRANIIHSNVSLRIKDGSGTVQKVCPLPSLIKINDSIYDEIDLVNGYANIKVGETNVSETPQSFELTNTTIHKISSYVPNMNFRTDNGLTITSELNRDNTGFIDHIYRATTGEVYLICAKSGITNKPNKVYFELPNVVKKRYPFVFPQYNRDWTFDFIATMEYKGLTSSTDVLFLKSDSTTNITGILEGKAFVNGILEYPPLAISADQKKVEGLTINKYHELLVTTDIALSVYPDLEYTVIVGEREPMPWLQKMIAMISEYAHIPIVVQGGGGTGGGVTTIPVEEIILPSVSTDGSKILDFTVDEFDSDNDFYIVMSNGALLQDDDYTITDNSRITLQGDNVFDTTDDVRITRIPHVININGVDISLRINRTSYTSFESSTALNTGLSFRPNSDLFLVIHNQTLLAEGVDFNINSDGSRILLTAPNQFVAGSSHVDIIRVDAEYVSNNVLFNKRNLIFNITEDNSTDFATNISDFNPETDWFIVAHNQTIMTSEVDFRWIDNADGNKDLRVIFPPRILMSGDTINVIIFKV